MTCSFEDELSARAKREGSRPLNGRWPPLRWALRAVVATCCVLTVPLFTPTALVLVPAILYLPVTLLVGLLPKLQELRGEEAVDNVEWALALQTFIVCGAACSIGAFGYRLFCTKTSLAVLPFFPVADRELFKLWWRVWLAALAYGVASWCEPTALIVWRESLDGRQTGGLLALGVVQAGHIAALWVTIAHHLPPRFKVTLQIGGVVVAGSAVLFALFLIEHPQAGPSSQLTLALFCSPFGWILGAMNYAVIEGHVAGWLLLAPAAMLWAYAIRLVARGFAIRELRCAATGEITPVFAYGFPNAREKRAAYSTPLSEARLTAHPALAPPDWSGGWFVERWLGKRLSSREKVVLEQVYGGRPRWTLSLAILFASALLILGIGAYVQAIGGSDPRNENVLSVFSLMLLAVFWLAEFAAVAASRGYIRAHALMPLFPCGLKETLAAQRKPFLWRLAFFAPLLALVVGVEHWHREERWRHMGAALVVVTTLIVAFAPLLARSPFSRPLQPRRVTLRDVLRRLPGSAAALLLCLIAFSLAAPLPWQSSLLCASLLIAGVRIACWRLDRQYVRGLIDLDTNQASLATLARSRLTR